MFVAAGFIAIGLGWNGMAKLAFVDSQFPYLLSGGATGLGLILFGTGLLVMAQIRSERLRLAEQLERVTGGLGGGAAASAPASANGQVVAGRSTYHRPDCRLVKDKPSLEFVSVESAVGAGLSPCRVCSPETVAAKTS